MPYLCTRNTTTGCSAVRLAHLVWDQRVPGSNPGIPTERDKKLSLFFCRAIGRWGVVEALRSLGSLENNY